MGEVGAPFPSEGESLSGEEARWRFEGCGSGDGGERGGMVSKSRSIRNQVTLSADPQETRVLYVGLRQPGLSRWLFLSWN